MLTELIVRNFKVFQEVRVELGNPVVFVGPNNSGKSSALQSLALWHLGLKRWLEKRGTTAVPSKRPGVTINRRDLTSVPVPSSKMLWRDLSVRKQKLNSSGARGTSNILIEIEVRGVGKNKEWVCGFEFDYANEESIYCRPLRLSEDKNPERMPIPPEAGEVELAFLPPMSGLDAREFRKDPGEIDTLIGEGRTAEVLRNLCHLLSQQEEGKPWQRVTRAMRDLFGLEVSPPQYVPERGELTMGYKDPRGVALDLSSSGRGAQQVLLLLTYLYLKPHCVLLLDEPDAHLEILRQRQIYNACVEGAEETGSQIVAASHSEILLNEAAHRHTVIAFVGDPHRIDDRGSQVLKSLRDVGFDQYYQAEIKGWVLYLEGSTDLSVLRSFARRLGHPACKLLDDPFVVYVKDRPAASRSHFHALKEAKKDLVGFALYDQLKTNPESAQGLEHYCWKRNEIENYLCQPETLRAYARHSASMDAGGPLFTETLGREREKVIEECIRDVVPPIALRDPTDSFWTQQKASDGFLDKVFREYHSRLGLASLLGKTDYHRLVDHVPQEKIDPEVALVLDRISHIADQARPRGH